MSNLPDHIRNQPWRRGIRSRETAGSSESPAEEATPTPLPALNSREQTINPENTLAETPSRSVEDIQWRRRAAPPTGDVNSGPRSTQWAAYGRRTETSTPPNPRPIGSRGFNRRRPSQLGRGVVHAPEGQFDADSTRRATVNTSWRTIVTSPEQSPAPESGTGDHQVSAGSATTAVGQTAEQARQFCAFERTCHQMQNITVSAAQCNENEEYAQWAGRYVEVDDRLLARICPCNLVGKPCPFDELEGGCPMIRLCGQLEKWTIHRCPDAGFRTILDAVENVPPNYGERFGAVNTYDGSDNESGGVALTSEASSEAGGAIVPEYRGKKVAFNDFSCGVENKCGHIHWEVEINCRFVGWSHVKPDTICKQVREKGRLCSCGHDLEEARRRARDAVREHERMAMRCGAPRPRDLGRVWVY